MANPPVYELVDSSGTVVGEFNQEVANNLLRISNEQTNTEIQVKNGEVDYQNNDINNVDSVDATSVTTDKADTRSGYVDETANRSDNTWYQNTSGSDMDVSIIINGTSTSSTLGGRLSVNDSQSFNKISQNRLSGISSTTERLSVSATVPSGYYYRLDLASDTNIEKWSEQT